MEDVELIGIGVLFAVGLCLLEVRSPSLLRIPAAVVLLSMTVVALWVFGLNVLTNATDFLQVDIGAFLAVKMMDASTVV